MWKSPGNENAFIVFGKPNLDGMQQQGENAFKDLNTPINPEGLVQ